MKGGVLTNFIWAVQMPGFMLVSGYFAARIIRNLKEAGKRIVLSVQYYALPFFSWFVLIDVLLLGRFGHNPLKGLTVLLNRVDGGLWFLWVVFVLSVIATLANFALCCSKCRAVKFGTIVIISLGALIAVAKVFGINFLGIKFILYYAIFYGFGWIVKWTEDWWKRWWKKAQPIVLFACLIIYLAIVFNFDLYHSADNAINIAMRLIAGFTGNAVLLAVCGKYEDVLSKARLDWIGMYTLEIYATHMCVNNLMEMGEGFFTLAGFGNFICSLIITVAFTSIIIAAFKAIPAADFIFFGKRRR